MDVDGLYGPNGVGDREKIADRASPTGVGKFEI